NRSPNEHTRTYTLKKTHARPHNDTNTPTPTHNLQSSTFLSSQSSHSLPSPHSLRSSDQHLLTVPFFTSSQARRSFLFAAPTVWNSLPLALRTSSSSTSFHSALKTHLFPP